MIRTQFSDLCTFTDKQKIATDAADTHRYTLFGGARGPGKSHWLRWWLIRFLLKHAGEGRYGVRTLLACEDYPTLRKRQIVKVQAEFPPWLGRYYAGERHEFVLHERYGAGVIEMGNLKDASAYMSAEYAAIAIDELTKNSERTFQILRASNRWPGIEDVKFIAASNPDTGWVRDYWIERPKRLPDELKGRENDFQFVRALPADNPHLTQSYWDELSTLPGALRDAWLHGDWYAAVEGLVYDTFSDANITGREPDPARPYELGIDDGYIHPRAVLFIQPSDTHILVFDEIYHSKFLPEETIDELVARTTGADWAQPEAINGTLPEMSAVAHEAVELRKRLRMADIPARNWMARKAGGKGTSTRVEAIKLTRSLIVDGKGYRSILINERCVNLLDEIRAGYKYREGARGLNERPMDSNDHAVHALENWCWLRARRSSFGEE